MTDTPEKILLLGSGGREHALAWKLAQSLGVKKILALPGNDGMAMLPKVECIAGNPSVSDTVVAAAKEHGVSLVVIGPETPLAAGVADALEYGGFAVMGPSKAAAQLESSKIFAKEFMREHGIPTAPFTVCDSHEDAIVALKDWPVEDKGIVIKANGLAAGKGVVVTSERAEAEQTLFDFMVNPACTVKTGRVLLEERLSGKEVSAFALCDGGNFITLGYACDYKRVRDNDEGPNTGGMGCYSPREWPSEKTRAFVEDGIFRPVIEGMKKRGTPFRGILFAGLMVQGDDAKVIEFNTRFGDPETQVLMPLIEDDMAPLFLQAAKGQLPKGAKVTLRDSMAVHVVMASEGYPETFGGDLRLGEVIDLPEGLLKGSNDNGLLFVMGARRKNGAWINEGGRVLGVTGMGASLEEARERAYSSIESIRFNGAHWRNDIGR